MQQFLKKYIFLVLLILIIGIGIAALGEVKREEKQELTSKPTVTKEVLDYFHEVAFGTEYPEKESLERLTKWEKDVVHIDLQGNELNPYLKKCLENVITDFNNISATTKLQLGGGKDIELYLTPVEKFSTILPQYEPDNYGYFYIDFTSKNEITHATVLINSNDPARDVERCHLIREELTQSMGLAKDSYTYEDSIFYQPWTNTIMYSDIDKELIHLLYNTGLESNMTAKEVDEYFNTK